MRSLINVGNWKVRIGNKKVQLVLASKKDQQGVSNRNLSRSKRIICLADDETLGKLRRIECLISEKSLGMLMISRYLIGDGSSSKS